MYPRGPTRGILSTYDIKQVKFFFFFFFYPVKKKNFVNIQLRKKGKNKKKGAVPQIMILVYLSK